MIHKLEYVWLDGYTPEPNLRSKVKVIKTEASSFLLGEIPEWNFDGSSTQQADGKFSDCILKPVRLYSNNHHTNIKTTYVLCEVMNPDGTPHESNQRNLLGKDDNDFWVGFEQEYFIREGKNRAILGHSPSGNGYLAIEPQGKYYCGIGSNVVGRELVEKHLDFCLTHGINITGTNAEVALGQWEYQVFSEGNKKACDDLWMARYFMEKLSETFGYSIEYHPKPLGNSDWNGSGLHTNFSTKKMREIGGEEFFKAIFNAFDIRHKNHIEVYGSDNQMRLTGKHETQSIDKFSVGVSDRGASIRVPAQTATNGWKGYVEDRRPASNANPYDIIRVISETLNMSEELSSALNNINSNVSHKEISQLYGKYKTLSPDELLNEYRDDNDYEVDSETMKGWNIPSRKIKFETNGK